MRHTAGRLAATLLGLGLSVSLHAEGKWTRLQTENFLFVGDASERQIRDVAQHLEQFRDVMSRALPPVSVASSSPTLVFVFDGDKSFAPYKPRFEGRPIDVSGYFQAGPDANYVAINAGNGPAALRIVFHEYAHFLTRNTAGDLPVWASEGLAGVYETFEERNGGRSAIIGLPNKFHLLLLQNSALMPLRELLAVDHSSPVYNEGDRRGVLYAESWALMHYLMLGNQARASELRDYLQRLRDGVPSDRALEEAFAGSPEDLERELREYIRNFSFPALRLDFPEKVSGSGAGRGQPLDQVDASAYLGELLNRLNRREEARALLQTLVEANPRSARAVSALGLLEARAGKVDDAIPLLERAAALDPANAAVQRAWGGALFAKSQEQTTDDAASAALLQKARTVLDRAIALSPDDAELLMILGRTESMLGSDHARATALLTRAVALEPGDERYQLMLADSLVRQREFTRARTYLGPLVGHARDPEIQETARDLLAFVARETARLDADASPVAAADAARPADADASSSTRQTAAGGRFTPQFRAVGRGERRVLGMFTSVECRPGSIALVIEAEGETLRLQTADLGKIEFITYRSTAPGAVGCGPVQPAARVFATFLDDDAPVGVSGIDGHAVAIELLPDDFTPR